MHLEGAAVAVAHALVEELVHALHSQVHSKPTDGAFFQWQAGIRDRSLTRVLGDTRIYERHRQSFVIIICT